jgi:glyoxylase-like metal-dependent hydrolase (beta-lactamase superfamily II)
VGPLLKGLAANNPPPVTPDREINEADELPIAGGLKVIHTPGHTAGSVAFLAPVHGGVLFAGDAAAHMMGRLGKPALIFTEDMDQAKESIRKLAALEFDTACFGHGSVVKGKANVEFRRYVEKMAK